MRVCLILEGSYPFVHGGVSSWTHTFIRNSPQHEFVLWTIGAHARDKDHFAYELPPNVTEVHQVFLDTQLLRKPPRQSKKNKNRFTIEELEALSRLFACEDPDWQVLIDLFQGGADPLEVLMGEDYLRMVTQVCRRKYAHLPFAKTFHTSRSMLLPVLHLLCQKIPQADLYHTICTGYGGLLGSMAHMQTGKPLILTEHGIYSREREEELIRANWVEPKFKRRWIRFFYMLSNICYSNAAAITSLFDAARAIQVDLGADAQKCTVIHNGVDFERFSQVPPKAPEKKTIIGAVIRLARIKDVKTMIYAFYELTQRMGEDAVELDILGDTDDEDYGRECHELVQNLDLHNLFFLGHQSTVEYLAKFDFTVLSSISEGQPLCILESMAAARPAVTTDVGSCRELLQGAPGDLLGPSGIIVPPMDRKAMADAMEVLCRNSRLRLQMGEAGQQRVERYYRTSGMMEGYENVYQQVMDEFKKSGHKEEGA